MPASVNTNTRTRCQVRGQFTHQVVSQSPWESPFPETLVSYLSNAMGVRDPVFHIELVSLLVELHAQGDTLLTVHSTALTLCFLRTWLASGEPAILGAAGRPSCCLPFSGVPYTLPQLTHLVWLVVHQWAGAAIQEVILLSQASTA
jgi:hypothetical protein